MDNRRPAKNYSSYVIKQMECGVPGPGVRESTERRKIKLLRTVGEGEEAPHCTTIGHGYCKEVSIQVWFELRKKTTTKQQSYLARSGSTAASERSPCVQSQDTKMNRNWFLSPLALFRVRWLPDDADWRVIMDFQLGCCPARRRRRRPEAKVFLLAWIIEKLKHE